MVKKKGSKKLHDKTYSVIVAMFGFSIVVLSIFSTLHLINYANNGRVYSGNMMTSDAVSLENRTDNIGIITANVGLVILSEKKFIDKSK